MCLQKHRRPGSGYPGGLLLRPPAELLQGPQLATLARAALAGWTRHPRGRVLAGWHRGSGAGGPGVRLCDLGQVTSGPYTSGSSSVKWRRRWRPASQGVQDGERACVRPHSSRLLPCQLEFLDKIKGRCLPTPPPPPRSLFLDVRLEVTEHQFPFHMTPNRGAVSVISDSYQSSALL